MWFKTFVKVDIFARLILIISLSRCDTLRLSQKKCEEYSKYVNSYQASPVLSMNTRVDEVSECGIIETLLIVGGLSAKEKEFPHMIAIGFRKGDRDNVSWECGGSLISEDYVMTAAHCIRSREKGLAYKARAGTINLKNPDFSYQDRKIIKHVKHPNYKSPAKYNDIALVQVESPFDLNGYVRPACLDYADSLPPTMIASGFGKTSWANSKGTDDLRKVQLDNISREDCEKSFAAEMGSRQFPRNISQNLICAGKMKGGKDTCQGDSGGPLQRVLSVPYCMYSVVGVTSFGKFCGFAKTPGMYTRVSEYLDWIESEVWPTSDDDLPAL